MVIPALRLDLGVLAQQVEAQRFHLAELPLHGCVRGRRIQALRPVALIQQTVEQDGLVVQAEAQHPVGVRCTAPLAQGKVTVHRVEPGFLPLVGAHRQVVKEGRVRAPWEEMLFRDVQGHFAVLVGLVAAPVLGDGHAPGPHHGPQVDRTAGLCRVHPHRHRAGVVVRGDGQGLDVVVRHPLQPDGLPDAALGRVEHPAGFQRLFAPGLGAVAGGVLHGHPQAVAAGAVEQVGNVQCEGPVAAPVAACQMPIDLHGAGVIHRPEVQQHPAALSRRRGEQAVVVQPLPRLQGAPHPGGRGLRRIGHPDGALPGRRVFGRLGDGILPRAVQDLTAVPAHEPGGDILQEDASAHRLLFVGSILAQGGWFV